MNLQQLLQLLSQMGSPRRDTATASLTEVAPVTGLASMTWVKKIEINYHQNRNLLSATLNTRRTTSVTVEAIMENASGVLAWTPIAIYFIASRAIALVDIPIGGKAALAGDPNPSIRFEFGPLDDVAPDFFSPVTGLASMTWVKKIEINYH